MEHLVYDVKDIMELLKVKQTTAYRIISKIKNYQDNLGLPGKVLISDFEKWKTRNNQG